jgi:hypothetical protein
VKLDETKVRIGLQLRDPASIELVGQNRSCTENRFATSPDLSSFASATEMRRARLGDFSTNYRQTPMHPTTRSTAALCARCRKRMRPRERISIDVIAARADDEK